MKRERYYRPRPEWVWDRAANPDLEARVDLRMHLRGPGAAAAVTSWLKGIGARATGDEVWVRGGTAAQREHHPGDELTLLLSSGGQDALESLDELVLTFHEQVLVPHAQLEVTWEELPLESSTAEACKAEP